jgi:hypothetical protein
VTADESTGGVPAPGGAEAQRVDGAPAAEPAPGQGAAPPDAGPAAEPAAPERRALKLVVSCRPEAGVYRVLLALGAEGCDPLFRTATADGLQAALDGVPALLAEAEERWRAQPRYPAATRPRPTATRPRAESTPAGGTASQAPAQGSPPARPAPAPKDPPAGQMALF